MRQLQTFLLGVSTLSVLFVLGACSGPKTEAEEVLSTYVLTETVGAKHAQPDLLVEADRKVLEKRLESNDLNFDTSVIAEVARATIGDKFDVAIQETEVDGNQMEVTAEVTRPKADELDEALKAEVFKAISEHEDSSAEETTAALEKATREALSGADLSTEKTTETFQMRRENGSWKVYRNLAAQMAVKKEIRAARKLARNKKYEAARDKADEIEKQIQEKNLHDIEGKLEGLRASILSSKARALKYENNYAAAIEKYEKIVEMDPSGGVVDKEKAQRRITSLKEKQAQKKSRQKYIEKLTVDGPTIETSLAGNKSVAGTIENNGGKALSTLELEFTFFDSDGNEIHRATKQVVRALGDEADALKPGDSEDYSHYPHEVPESWDGESVEVEVKALEFLD